MKKHLLLLFILVLCLSRLSGQNYWADRYGGLAGDEVMSVTTDSSGNHYLTGYFSVNSTFGSNTLTSAGVTDIMLVKTSPNGNVLWAVQAGGSGSDRGLSVHTDNLGFVYLTGFYTGSATFGSVTLTAAGGSQDIFVAKYTQAGALVWANSYGGTSTEQGNSIYSDPAGNVIVTGQFKNSATFGSTTLTSMTDPTGNPSIDVFTLKIRPGGSFVWVEQGTAKLTDRGLGVAADQSGNIYVTGQFSDTITFDQTYNTGMLNQAFLIKYDSTGTQQWFRQIVGGTFSVSNAVSLNAAGNIFITGEYGGTLSFTNSGTTLTNIYPYRVFVTGYSPSGSVLWANGSGSSSEISARDIHSLNSGNLFITGDFKCTFNGMADIYGQGLFNSVGFRDVYVSSYTQAGVFNWARQAGGKEDDFSRSVNRSGSNPIIAGSFHRRLFIPSPAAISTLGGSVSAVTNIATQGPYCNDPLYDIYGAITVNGNLSQVVGNNDGFALTMLDNTREPFDYYYRSGSGCNKDQVSVCISTSSAQNYGNCAPDTITSCGPINLYAHTNTAEVWHSQPTPWFSSPPQYTSNGPEYNYMWSTGSIYPNINATISGTYWVKITSLDGCFEFTDTIFVDITGFPPKPCISDNYFPATDTSDYDIIVCNGDTITAWGGCKGPSVVQSYWQTPSGIIQQDTITFSTAGLYSFCVTDSNNCTSCSELNFQIDTLVLLPPIVAAPVPFINDSVSICEGEILNVTITDTTQNSIPFVPPAYFTMDYCYTINGVTTCPPIAQTYPNIPVFSNTSGYVTLTFTLNLIISNACSIDTISSDTSYYFYLNLMPKPVVSASITGPTVLCPGDSDTLFGSGIGNLTWVGPPHTVLNDSTIIINTQGYYVLSSQLTSADSCTSYTSAAHIVTYKPSPVITSNPTNGVICPGDSVALTSSFHAGTYNWQGPNGYIGNTQTVYANTPGNYYVILTDPDSCQLVSNTLQLKQYTTPYLVADTNMACSGDSVKLEVFGTEGNTLTWLAPLSGSSAVQYGHGPGTYSVSVSGCGFDDTLSVTINPSTVSATIVPGDISFCAGDTVIFSTTPNMPGYTWSTGATVDSILATQPGTYSVTILDTNGCYVSDTVTLSLHTTPPPVLSDTVICMGDSIVLNSAGNGTVNWYQTSTSATALHTGPTFQTPPISANTVYYASLTDTLCTSVRVPVTITLDSASLPFTMSSNSPVCEGSSLQLTGPSIQGISWSWSGPGTFSSNVQNPVVNPVQLSDSGFYYLNISSGICFVNQDSIFVTVKPLPTPVATSNSPVCAGDTLRISGDTIPGVSYIWLTPNGLANGQNLIYPNSNTGHSGTYILAVNMAGCVNNDTVQVTVNPIPATPQPINNTPVCEGDSILLFNAAVTSGTYNWTGPSGFTSGQQNPFIFPADTFHAGNYVLTVTENGCTSDSGFTFVSVLGVPDSIPVTANSPLCEGDSLSLFASASSSGTFSWNGPNGFTSNSQQVSIPSITQSQAGFYTVNYVTVDGCPAPSGQVFVIVNPIPAAPVATANDSICADDILILSSSHSLNGLFNWSGPAGFSSTAKDTTFPGSVSNSGWYFVTLTMNGCTSPPDSVFTTILPAPRDPDPVSNDPLCEGKTVILSSTTTPGAVYSWTGPNGFTSSSSTVTIPNATSNSNGTYFLTAVIGKCSKGPFPVNVTINPNPELELRGDTTLCYGGTTDLIAPSGYHSMIWNTGSQQNIITADSAGTYILMVGNIYNCFTSDSVDIEMVDCVNFEAPNVFSPNGDGVNDVFLLWHHGVTGLRVKIFNRWGQLLDEWAEPYGGWDGYIRDTGRLASEGVYYWVADYQLYDGTQFSKSGFFHLIR